MKRGPKPVRPRVAAKLPEQIVEDLMGAIRRQFCPDLSARDWMRNNYHFIRLRVVLWPAAFMRGKGFALSGERYQEILLGILDEIKRKGNTGAVRCWHAYLTMCVQRHFEHHWEEYYAEAKSARAQAEAVLVACGQAAPAEDRGTEALAAAHGVLTAKKRRCKLPASQGELGL